MENMRMPEISRARAIGYLLVVVAALVVGGRLLLGGDHEGSRQEAATTAALTAGELVPVAGVGSGPEPTLLVVHVAGAVRQPGLYEVPEGSRVDDVIRAAGGPRRTAVLDLLNLAAPVVDGQQVLVPARGSRGNADASATTGPAGPAAQVSLNTASVEQLDTLPGVGPVTAQKIVAYRTEHGPFASIEELDAIPGIGPARLEQLRGLVTL
jgi:competence protein ComEA